MSKNEIICKILKHSWEWQEARVTEIEGSGKRAHQHTYKCARCGATLILKQPIPEVSRTLDEYRKGPLTNMFANVKFLNEEEIRKCFEK